MSTCPRHSPMTQKHGDRTNHDEALLAARHVRTRGRLRRPAAGVAGIAGVITGAAWWLLLGDGLATLAGWLGWKLQAGRHIRRLALAVGFSIYYIRILFTVFVFLRRGMGWVEVLSITPFMLLAVLLMGVSGGPITRVRLGGKGRRRSFSRGLVDQYIRRIPAARVEIAARESRPPLHAGPVPILPPPELFRRSSSSSPASA